MAEYSATYITFDNKLLAEEASVTIDKKSGLQPVYTVVKGFAGMSPGASMMEMTIDSAVPSSDFEVNPDPFMEKGKLVEVGAVMANRQQTAKMYIVEATYSHAVNQESKVVIKLMGPFKPWE